MVGLEDWQLYGYEELCSMAELWKRGVAICKYVGLYLF